MNRTVCSKTGYKTVDTNLYGTYSSTTSCNNTVIYRDDCSISYSCCFTNYCNICPSTGCYYTLYDESSTLSPSSDGSNTGTIVDSVISVLVCICCVCGGRICYNKKKNTPPPRPPPPRQTVSTVNAGFILVPASVLMQRTY